MTNKTSYYDFPVVTAEPVGLSKTRSTKQIELPTNQHTLISERQLERLVEQGYTVGLAKSLNKTKAEFAQRIWVVDNSGSMQATDGHRIIETLKPGDVKMVECSRWEEIQECVNYHISLAGALGAPTCFRLMNDPGITVGAQQFSVAEDPENIIQDMHEAQRIIRTARPGGCTPLTSHILEIQQEVKNLAPALRANGQRVVVCVATDGLPTDERGYGGDVHQRDFVDALRLLEGLPVWIVIRLCTDEEKVVEFYNDLDQTLELSIEVLDDFNGEAQEVHQCNPWLNYALPLHRMREMGYHDRVFDMLDERLLTKSELRDFCCLLFGEEKFDGVPDPSLDWVGFVQNIERMLERESPQWNPIKKRMKPWISIKRLNRSYRNAPSCVIL